MQDQSIPSLPSPSTQHPPLIPFPLLADPSPLRRSPSNRQTNLLSLGSLGQLLLPRLLGRPPLLQQGLGDGDLLGGGGGGGDGHSCWMISFLVVVVGRVGGGESLAEEEERRGRVDVDGEW